MPGSPYTAAGRSAHLQLTVAGSGRRTRPHRPGRYSRVWCSEGLRGDRPPGADRSAGAVLPPPPGQSAAASHVRRRSPPRALRPKIRGWRRGRPLVGRRGVSRAPRAASSWQSRLFGWGTCAATGGARGRRQLAVVPTATT